MTWQFHDSLFAGHLGISRTVFRHQTRVYWPGLRQDVRTYSTNHVYLHRPNAFGFWQTRLHLCYETLKRVSNFSELA